MAEKFSLKDFIDELNAALSLIELNKVTMPLPPVQEGEKILWTLPEELQKLMTYSHLLSKESMSKQVDLVYSYSPMNPQGRAATQEVRELSQKSTALREILWYLIHTNIGDWDEAIALRDGFHIVELAQNERR